MQPKSNSYGTISASQKAVESHLSMQLPELRRNSDLPEVLQGRYMEVSAAIAECLAAATRLPDVEVLQRSEITGSSDVLAA